MRGTVCLILDDFGRIARGTLRRRRGAQGSSLRVWADGTVGFKSTYAERPYSESGPSQLADIDSETVAAEIHFFARVEYHKAN